MARESSDPPKQQSFPEDSNLTVGQRNIINHIRELGRPVDAWSYAIFAFGRDIEELEMEELGQIPDFCVSRIWKK